MAAAPSSSCVLAFRAASPTMRPYTRVPLDPASPQSHGLSWLSGVEIVEDATELGAVLKIFEELLEDIEIER